MANEVFSWSSSSMRIWLYPENASMKLKSLCPTVKSTSWLILGKGKLFFGQTIFRFAVWSSYQFQAYPRVYKQKHLGFLSRRKPSSFFSRIGSADPIFNTFVESSGMISTSYGVSDGSGMALVHWSLMCGSPQMLRQLGSTLLPELGLLWFLLPYGLLEISPSSNMLTSLLLAC